MPRIADFIAIRDSKFNLTHTEGEGGFAQSFDFTLEADTSVASRAVLSFMAITAGSVDGLALRVTINGHEQIAYTIDGVMFTTIQEVLGGNVLRTGANEITFNFAGGTGTINFSDVVLHYQRDI